MGTQEFNLAVCDCDEVYDIRKLPSKEDMLANKTHIIYPQMEMFYYRFSHELQVERWSMCFIIHSSLIQEPLDLTEIRVNKQISDEPVNSRAIACGWHFSFFMSTEDIQRKIKSFSHTEFDLPHITDTAEIRRRIHEGLDVFSRVNLNIRILDEATIAEKFPHLFLKYQAELLQLQHDVA
jgi:hypothetical protein